MKNVLCKHKRQKGHCRACQPKKFCQHLIHQSHCRVCRPRGWASGILSVAKGAASRRGYTPPRINSENLVLLMKVSKFCAGCGGKLEWNNKPTPHLHHSHKTGRVSGFCHQLCNQSEGMLSKLSIEEQYNFVKNFFPHLLDMGSCS